MTETPYEARQGGAFEATEFTQLLHKQASALRRLCIRAAEILEHERGPEAHGAIPMSRRRPRNVFLIDGPRGSGKTTVLLTAQKCFEALGGSGQGAGRHLLQQVMESGGGSPPPTLGQLAPTRRRTAIEVIPEIFPSDLESQQSTMEAIFAALRRSLEERATEERKRNPSLTPDGAVKLIKDLDLKVAGSWRLSQPSTSEAILRDSITVASFLEMSAEYGANAQNRVREWRDFITRFLDYMDAELLAFFFDDTDTHANADADLLHAIRIFLDHPRIVSVIAGNMKAMRRSLLDGARPPHGAADPGVHTITTTEEFLEKVIPPPNRFYIGARSNRSERIRDHEKIYGQSFDLLCRSQLHRLRLPFLVYKWRAVPGIGARQVSDDDTYEAERTEQSRHLESYSSWWLLRHYYADALEPRTARQQMNFRRLAVANNAGEVEGHGPSKRLAVVLFEVAENEHLIARFTDADSNVLTWLRRRVLMSQWVRDRYFMVDGEKLAEGVYEFDYICYRIDLGIAGPLFNSPEEDIPDGLLPRPVFRDTDGRARPLTRFRCSSGRYPRFGVARAIRSQIVPANCIYVRDLLAINDWLWVDTSGGSEAAMTPLLSPSRFHAVLDYERTTPNQVFRSSKDEEEPTLLALHVGATIRELIVPLASLAQLRVDRGEPNEAKRPLALWRGMGQQALDLTAHAVMAVEQWSGAGVRALGESGGSVATSLAVQNAWIQLGAQVRNRPKSKWDYRKVLQERHRLTPAEVENAALLFINLNAYAAKFNDYISAHLATRIYKSDLAACLRAEEEPQEPPAADKQSRDEERRRIGRRRRVALRYGARALQFMPSEPARILVLEDLADLLDDAVTLEALPPGAFKDGPILLKKLKIHDKDAPERERGLRRAAEQFPGALPKFFGIQVLAGSANPPDGSVKGFEEAVEAGRKIVDLVFRQRALSEEERRTDPSEECARWIAVWRTAQEYARVSGDVSSLDRLLGLSKGPSPLDRDIYWMWPEFTTFTTSARAARAFLLYVYGLTPSLRTLFETERMTFESPGFKRAQPSASWHQRAYKWIQLAGAMRRFVCRYASINWLAHFRIGLREAFYGSEDRSAGLQEAVNDLETHIARSDPDRRIFAKSCGIQFALAPDISLETLGIIPSEVGTRVRHGLVNTAFDELSDFIEVAARDFPETWCPPCQYEFGSAAAAKREAPAPSPGRNGGSRSAKNKR